MSEMLTLRLPISYHVVDEIALGWWQVNTVANHNRIPESPFYMGVPRPGLCLPLVRSHQLTMLRMPGLSYVPRPLDISPEAYMRQFMKLDPDVAQHPKILQVSAELGIRPSYVVGTLVGLWSWAFKTSKDGRVRITRYVTETIIGTGTTCERYINALCRAGLLDDAGEGEYLIHGWENHQGAWLEARETNRRRVAKYREMQQSEPDVTRTVRDTYALRNAPEKRREEKKREEVPPISPKGDFTDADFETLWTAYDHKNGSKAEAKKRWVKILKSGVVTKEQLLVSVQNYKADCVASNRFQQDASTFLGDTKQTYMNYLEPVEPAKKAGGNGSEPKIADRFEGCDQETIDFIKANDQAYFDKFGFWPAGVSN